PRRPIARSSPPILRPGRSHPPCDFRYAGFRCDQPSVREGLRGEIAAFRRRHDRAAEHGFGLSGHVMDPMSSPWHEVGCVRIAIEDLRVLADLRGRAEIRVSVVGGWAWVFWEPRTAPMPEVLVGRLLPLPGVEMFTRRGENWYRLGARLPAFE